MSSWGWWQTGKPPAWELWECTLPNGLVALAGSLSQPICSSSPTDTTLAAFVTAWLSTQGCSPLGIRENPKARTDLGTTRSSRAAGGNPFCICPSVAGCGRSWCGQKHWHPSVSPGPVAPACVVVSSPPYSHPGKGRQHCCPHFTDEGVGRGGDLLGASQLWLTRQLGILAIPVLKLTVACQRLREGLD